MIHPVSHPQLLSPNFYPDKLKITWHETTCCLATATRPISAGDKRSSLLSLLTDYCRYVFSSSGSAAGLFHHLNVAVCFCSTFCLCSSSWKLLCVFVCLWFVSCLILTWAGVQTCSLWLTGIGWKTNYGCETIFIYLTMGRSCRNSVIILSLYSSFPCRYRGDLRT